MAVAAASAVSVNAALIHHWTFDEISGSPFIGDGAWRIGNDPCCGDRDFDGMIDDLAVFDNALTAADAAAIFTGAGNGFNVAESIPELSVSLLGLLAGLVAFRRRR